jgi:hypothetical protein
MTLAMDNSEIITKIISEDGKVYEVPLEIVEN